MMNKRVLHIGIASREAIKARTIAIANGELRPSPDAPRIWFSSLESLAKVLSEKNMLLLDMIRRSRPASIAELAQLSGRAVSNLSRTLHNMERFGLIELRKSDGRTAPVVLYERLIFDLEVDGDEPTSRAA
jgi:predicted transcriptional regulator